MKKLLVCALLTTLATTAEAEEKFTAGAAAPTSSKPPEGCGVPDDVCPPRFWVRAEYLQAWIKDGPTSIPLLTTGPNNVLFSGSLDIAGTQILFGDKLDYGSQSGLRISAGTWLDQDSCRGFEASFFFLETATDGIAAAGNAAGQPFLARPFINAITGEQNVYFVSQNFTNPDLSANMTGSIDIDSRSRMWGLEANGIRNLRRCADFSADFLAGFRFTSLSEDLSIDEVIGNVDATGGGTFFNGAAVDFPGTVATFDSFDAKNRFYGGQVGSRLDWQRGRLNMGLTGKIALGVTHQEINIAGRSVLLDAAGNPTATARGGVQAVSSNIGDHTNNEFSIIPELGINIGYQLRPNIRATLGYNFLYWTNVARPGEQIDPQINPGLVPTDATFGTNADVQRPAFTASQSDFWMQSLSLGLELRY